MLQWITDLPTPLVLTDKPCVSWEYKQNKLFVKKIIEGELSKQNISENLVLGEMRGKLTMAWENSTSPSQKWTLTATGLS